MKQEEIYIKSTKDGSLQPSIFFGASKEGRPMLVGLHSWSCDRYNLIDRLLPLAQKHDFNLLLPNFRGANLKNNINRTKALGSEFAKQDIKDAIDFFSDERGIDKSNVFLLGASGGGHMALMMAGFCPSYFKAIAAFVPITDLKKWAEENQNYREHILACCDDSEAEMQGRSPISYIDKIATSNLKIFHGKQDRVVPFSHSLLLYNKLIEKYPQSSVFLDIFDGGHELDLEAAEKWILSQYKTRQAMFITG